MIGTASRPNQKSPFRELRSLFEMEKVAARPEAIIFRPVSYVERLNVAALFSASQPLEIELGAGDGSFLAQWAALNPERNFLGVERLLGRLRKIERKSRRVGLTNVRAL